MTVSRRRGRGRLWQAQKAGPTELTGNGYGQEATIPIQIYPVVGLTRRQQFADRADLQRARLLFQGPAIQAGVAAREQLPARRMKAGSAGVPQGQEGHLLSRNGVQEVDSL